MTGFRGGLVERYLRRQWKFLLSMKCTILFSVAWTRASVARNMMICLRVCRCSWRADSSGMRCSFFVDIPSEQGEEESEHFLVLSCWRMALIFWVIMHLRNLYKSPSFSPLGGVKRLGVPRCQPALIYARGDGFQPVSFHTRNHVSLIKKQFSNTWDNHVNAFFRLI